jgi:peptide-methionine (S)-S-oxide reductase
MEKTETVAFGGGCFWCTEAVFKMLTGVVSVLPGYAGGNVPNPTYEQVSTGQTGHAEVAWLKYDPSLISLSDLLAVFFTAHDATTLNRQGNDIGTQYRSVIFYTTEQQKVEAEKYLENINSSTKEGKPVVTEIKKLDTFYEAENYHKDYFEHHKDEMYCQLVINPKLKKVEDHFTSLLKTHAK